MDGDFQCEESSGQEGRLDLILHEWVKETI